MKGKSKDRGQRLYEMNPWAGAHGSMGQGVKFSFWFWFLVSTLELDARYRCSILLILSVL